MNIIALLYMTFLLCVLIGSVIVLFHLLKYSLDQKLARVTAGIFVVITLLLTVLNFFYFTNIPFDQISTF